MSSIFLLKKHLIDRIGLILLFLLPLLSSCSSNQNKSVEIITPPTFSNEFSSIPEQTENPQLVALLSSDEQIENITVGREDPFLPPQLKGNLLFVPDTFKYHGHISSKDIINAFVSFQDRRGTIKPGDIGGKSTDLLPNRWVVLNLDLNSQILTLGFEDRSVDIELFTEK